MQPMENLYANVPRDLTRVKSKIFLNLTRRQLLCFGGAVLIGVPLFFFVRRGAGTTAGSEAGSCEIPVNLPRGSCNAGRSVV